MHRILAAAAVLAATAPIALLGTGTAHADPCDHGGQGTPPFCVPPPPPPAPVPSGYNLIVGSRRADVIFGTIGKDAIFGMGGNDRLHGLPSNDLLFGGRGNDRLNGGRGRDVMRGGPGFDTCIGTRLDVFINCERVVLR